MPGPARALHLLLAIRLNSFHTNWIDNVNGEP